MSYRFIYLVVGLLKKYIESRIVTYDLELYTLGGELYKHNNELYKHDRDLYTHA